MRELINFSLETARAAVAKRRADFRARILSALMTGNKSTSELRALFPEFAPAYARTTLWNRLQEIQREGLVERAGHIAERDNQFPTVLWSITTKGKLEQLNEQGACDGAP